MRRAGKDRPLSRCGQASVISGSGGLEDRRYQPWAWFLLLTGLPWAKVWGDSLKEVRKLTGTTLLNALRNVPGAQADLSFTGSHSQVVALRGAIADSGAQSSRVVRDGAPVQLRPHAGASSAATEKSSHRGQA